MKLIFEGQFTHLAAAFLLLTIVYALSEMPGFREGIFLDVSTLNLAILAVTVTIVHQIYVWLCWRMELHRRLLTRLLGNKAFNVYAVGFVFLIVCRPILIFALGWSNRETLVINVWLGYGICAFLFIPTAYLMFSIKHYFTFRRAFGIDHFDPNASNIAFVRQGIFRWSPNAMYVFGFMGLWIPAFLFQSVTALIVAAFSHVYIWVHYYATEKPDMVRIYG
ncbi:MAG: methyltransferase [Pseudomonadota bacterium]|nr:methyltransferase [Pseudomonadota bacterium]